MSLTTKVKVAKFALINEKSYNKTVIGFNFGRQKDLLYDWRESCLLIGPICLHKSLCLPGNWSEPVHNLYLHENRLELVSRS